MDIIVLLIITIFTILSIYYAFSDRCVYEKHSHLMTRCEASFFRTLHKCVGNKYYIFSKVRIADVLKPKSTFNRDKWWKSFTKISSKHVDFVLCNKSNMKIACCIELDDSSHRKQTRKKRDAFVNKAFSQAGMPLLRIKTASTYDLTVLKRSVIGKAIIV